MSTFQQRLTTSVEGYRKLQGEDGGWGADPWVGSPTSIVNTVEVLAVLRAAKVHYEDPAVTRALKYVSEAVFTHPRPTRDGGRGANTRYCAWGLSGLTLFKESRHDPALLEAQCACVNWLAANECQGKAAWGDTPLDEHPSITSTSAAITGLSRMCGYQPAGEQASDLVERARAVVRRLARQTRGAHPKASWPLRADLPRQPGSASATAMAVIALAGGSKEDRTTAFHGAEWLLAHTDLWENRIEIDGSDWRHMTFSLALRAILRGRHQANATALREVVRYFDLLWFEEKGQWSHGSPGWDPSPSGAYAVVAAYEAISNAWPFDAGREILGVKASSEQMEIQAEVRLQVFGTSAKLIDDLDQSELVVEFNSGEARMMSLLGRRRLEGRGNDTLEPKSWDMSDLAKELGVRASTVERYKRDINKRFRDEASRVDKPTGDVVLLRESTTSTSGVRALIAVENVSLTE
jgi:hypothetical protein